MERLVCLLIGYIFGLFQTGYFYGKTQGVDIRKMGSGNAGSTNALRTMGIKAGMITLLGDCFEMRDRGSGGPRNLRTVSHRYFTAPFAVYRFWGSAWT